MSEPDPQSSPNGVAPALAVPVRNAGQTMVAAFRAARLQQRPTVQSELRAEREALRQERLTRLGRGAATAAAEPLSAAAPVAAGLLAAKDEQAEAPAMGSSMFSQFIDGAQAEVAEAVPVSASIEHAESLPRASGHQVSAPPLSSIGFGPGMVIRFRQLGIETAADLAGADAAALRTALGDITRLINVDIWIASAQKACAEAA